jgi:hypothetical protein
LLSIGIPKTEILKNKSSLIHSRAESSPLEARGPPRERAVELWVFNEAVAQLSNWGEVYERY